MIFKNVDFDIYDGIGITDNDIKDLFVEFLNNIRQEDISYIEICDRNQGYIFIEKEEKKMNGMKRPYKCVIY